MNRQQRRAHLRSLPDVAPAAPEPELCAPGQHQLGPIRGTVKGDVVVTVVLCSRCRRTFGEILEQDPAYAAMYQEWLDAGEPDQWPPKAVS